MPEQLSIRPDGEDRTAAQAPVAPVLIIAMVVGGLATSAILWLMLTKHPFGWGGPPPELLALSPHPTQVEIQGALAAAQQRVLRQLVLYILVEGLLVHVVHRTRAPKPAGAAALGLSVAGALVSYAAGNALPFIVGLAAGVYCLLAIKTADQWEKGAVLRFGRYHGVRGPGIFRIIPIVDRVVAFVDERVRTTAVYAEAALTRDAVPVNVDAVVFWIVWDVEKAVLEVQDFDRTIGLVAQTALVESIGRHALGDMIAERGALGAELQQILEEKTTPWGITVQSVEIRDVRLPAALQDALSRRAQAERERQARNTLATAEIDIAAKFAEASLPYQNDAVALHLRAMNMLFEAIKEKGSMVVVPTSSLRKRAGRTGLPRRS